MERLSGWGRYPRVDCLVERPPDEWANAFHGNRVDGIARGNGRSYGDASLNPRRTIDMRRLDRLIEFDEATGLITCQSGVLLSELIDVILPRGWFPPVTPGTKLVTIGGMVASDVHGKNHHGAGSFCDYVEWLDLAIGAARILRCSRTDHADLFAATCGGMGLTGIVLRVCFRMLRVETACVRQRKVRAPSLEMALETIGEATDWTYSVAWIDCLAKGRNLGRSVVLLGEHALVDELPGDRRRAPFERISRRAKLVPFDFPPIALDRRLVGLFNRCYYAAQRDGDSIVDLDPYFYPLDAVLEWNRIYGRSGFVQYQIVLPLTQSRIGMRRLLTEIATAGGGSFLAVLKRMGPSSFGMLSFPMEGYTLALDFQANRDNLAVLERLDDITCEYGGRVYLSKDARLSPRHFRNYPMLDAFRAVRRRYGVDRQFQSLLSSRLEI